MLKQAALERAERMARFLSAINLKGYGQIDRDLERVSPALTDALNVYRDARAGERARAAHALAGALYDAGIALKQAREETGLSGFGSLSNEAGTLSLLFSGFALSPATGKRARG